MSSLSKNVEIDNLPKIMSPLSTRSLFWKARHLDESPLLEHLPFLFWLVETQRPRLHVSLGVGEGVGYFAICQAIDRLEPEARNVGVDFFPKEAHENWEAINRVNEEFYSENSKLINDHPGEFEPEFRKGSVDLLMVSHEISSQLSDRILGAWLPNLSPCGVVVFHGVMRPGFGASPGGALLEKLRREHSSIRFESGEGIEVFLYGREQNSHLQSLASLTTEDANYNLVHAIFARLGATHRFEWSSKSYKISAKNLEARASASDLELATVHGKLAKLEGDYGERHQRASELQARCYDLEQRVQATELKCAKVQNENTTLSAQIAETEAALKATRDERDEARRQSKALGAQIAETEAALKATRDERDEARLESEALGAQLAETEATIASMERRSAVAKEVIVSMEGDITQFASAAVAYTQENSKLTTKLHEAEIRLETRKKEVSQANARADMLQMQLAVLRENMEDKPSSNMQVSALVQKERAFIRTLESKFSDLVNESLRLTESYSAQSKVLYDKETQYCALEQEFEKHRQDTIALLRRLDLRGAAMATLRDSNALLKLQMDELHQRYNDIVDSTSWSLTAPARKTVNWFRKSRKR